MHACCKDSGWDISRVLSGQRKILTPSPTALSQLLGCVLLPSAACVSHTALPQRQQPGGQCKQSDLQASSNICEVLAFTDCAYTLLSWMITHLLAYSMRIWNTVAMQHGQHSTFCRHWQLQLTLGVSDPDPFAGPIPGPAAPSFIK